MTYRSDLATLQRNPCARYKLQAAVTAFDTLDPVDALHDAQVLLGLCEKRCSELGHSQTMTAATQLRNYNQFAGRGE